MLLSKIVRGGALGLTFAAMGLVGSASASSGIALTGPYSTNIINEQTGTVTTVSNRNDVNTGNYNNQNASSGSAFVGGNTGIGSGWDSWDPNMWQQNGRSFGDWWNGMMGQMGMVSAATWGYGSSSTWQPSSSNWQGTWSNWDPSTWRSMGATYGDWYGCMMSYLTNHYSGWMNNWNSGGNGGYGSAMSGQAQNYNSTGNNVGISNNTYVPNNGGGSGNGQGTIYLTGPHSTNVIESSSNQNTRVNNDNNVNTTNENNQNARSGNATVSGNTFGGNAQSGDAVNENQTDNNVNIENNTNVPGNNGNNGNGGGFIGTTGPHSTNIVRSDNRSSFSENNTNDVNTYNSNYQNAQSGNARVSGNTIGGNATTGAAYNSNSTNNETNISNN